MGLANLFVRCPECGARRSLDGIFGRDAMQGRTCNGYRPWLPTDDTSCDKTPRVLQRGASNLYFPLVRSALSIPPWSDRIQLALGRHFDPIINIDPSQRLQFIKNKFDSGELALFRSEFPAMTAEELDRIIGQRERRLQSTMLSDLRPDEYLQFTQGDDVDPTEDREFQTRNVQVPQVLEPYFDRIVRVVRLREVRAIAAFTRINPPANDDPAICCPISTEAPTWLPAVEVRGEGIFLSLNQERLEEWECQEEVVRRAVQARLRTPEEVARGDRPVSPEEISPRFMLVHTLAHALMRQLTLECGYSSASLRERLYVGPGNPATGMEPMAGLLIYTSTSDSDGTLGGLERQGLPERIEQTVRGGLKAMEWCSSDPLCIQGS